MSNLPHFTLCVRATIELSTVASARQKWPEIPSLVYIIYMFNLEYTLFVYKEFSRQISYHILNLRFRPCISGLNKDFVRLFELICLS